MLYACHWQLLNTNTSKQNEQKCLKVETAIPPISLKTRLLLWQVLFA